MSPSKQLTIIGAGFGALSTVLEIRKRDAHIGIKGGRVVETTTGGVLNDALVIASGGRFLKKLPGIEHAITPCEGISAAERIRDRLKADAQCRVEDSEQVYVVGDSGSFPGPDWMPKQAHMADNLMNTDGSPGCPV